MVKGISAATSIGKSLFNGINKSNRAISLPFESNLSLSKIGKKLFELESKCTTKPGKISIKGKDTDIIVYLGSCEGSNMGFWAKIKDTGELYYIKNPGGGSAQGYSEIIASKLYGLTGIKTADLSLATSTTIPEFGVRQANVASKFMPIDALPKGAEAPLLREGFAADCWLANWDALKSGNVVISEGKIVRLDVGGSLCYRARGGRKGLSFNEDVNELVTFFDKGSQSRQYLLDMTRNELIDSLKRVAKIKDSDIEAIINELGYQQGFATGISKQMTTLKSIENPETLKELLILRKKYLRDFMNRCISTPQIPNENIETYIRRIHSQMPRVNHETVLYFDHLKMGRRCRTDLPCEVSLGEILSPSQRKLLEDSAKAFLESSKAKISHIKNDIISKDCILHGTSAANLEKILDKGIISGTMCGDNSTLVPMCTDFWAVQRDFKIKEYFSRSYKEFGREAAYLPRITEDGNVIKASDIVVVVNKNSVNSTIIKNSFYNAKRQTDTILSKDGNISGYFDPTHYNVPIGTPANSIEKIIINVNSYTKEEIERMKDMIRIKGLDIQVYDVFGNLL